MTEREVDFTIEKTDRETIADAVRELYEVDPETRERMGARGYEYVLVIHTWEAIIRQILTDLSLSRPRSTGER